MSYLNRFSVTGIVLFAGSALIVTGSSAVENQGPGEFRNEAGIARTVSGSGHIDLNGPFFQSLGTNGRKCVTCHQPSQAWSITPEGARELFDDTDGKDALFRLNDGANSPNADVSTVGKRRKAYSMLLTKGLIRVE